MTAGSTVLVRDSGPVGWIGRVEIVTGTTLLVIAPNGGHRLVDYTRHEVRAM